MVQFSKKYFLFLIIFLGLLSAFGPFVTDMYLPTLPEIAAVFGATASQVQLSMSMSLIGLAVGQLFFGPLSDKYGRRSVLIASMVLFAVSTVVSIYSTSIEFFNGCRFLQGLGGSGGIVLARSIATDIYTGRELGKIMAIIGAIVGIAPVTAPVLGGLVSEQVGWKGIFWMLFGLGIILLVMCLVFRESHAAERRYHGSVLSLMRNFGKLFGLRYYMVYVCLFGFASASLFAYVASASFVIQGTYGLSQLVFALLFGVNASGIGIGSALALKVRSMKHAAFVGALLVLATSAVQLVFAWTDYPLYVYEPLSFFMLLGVGYLFTSTSTMAMDEGREYVGAAAAVLGALGFLMGGIVSPLVGIGNIVHTTSVIMLIGALPTMALAVVTLRRKK